MGKQIVVSGNRILAYGEDCFLSMGGTVICPETEKAYQNATIIEIETGFPSDINEVGYEYRNGNFVPCAPYGKGTGSLAVVCGEDCKSIKNSGIPAQQVCTMERQTYTGGGSNKAKTLTFDGYPSMIFIHGRKSGTTDYNHLTYYPDIQCGYGWDENNEIHILHYGTTITQTSITFTSEPLLDLINASGYEYQVMAICTAGGVPIA